MVCIHCQRHLADEMFPFEGVPACWECLTPEAFSARVESWEEGPKKSAYLTIGSMYGLLR